MLKYEWTKFDPMSFSNCIVVSLLVIDVYNRLTQENIL